MHTSQANLSTSNRMTASVPVSVEDSQIEERRRKIAIAAGNETSSIRLRSNLLHKLGIRDETKQTEAESRQPIKGLLDSSRVRQEPLKYDSDEDAMEEDDETGPRSWTERLFFKPSSVESSADDTAPSSASSASTGDRRLTFKETVNVMPIPMRADYSQRVRERLWNDADEIMLNAQRNAMEFASEGWDWRTVIEDEYMYRDASSNEKIHPVHMEEHYE